MSDRRYPFTAIVVVGAGTLRGCAIPERDASRMSVGVDDHEAARRACWTGTRAGSREDLAFTEADVVTCLDRL